MNHAELEKLADAILARIRVKPHQPFSFSWLANQYKCGVEEVRQAIHHASAWGYEIDIKPDGWLLFVAAPDSLTATEIQHDLRTKWVGKSVLAYRSVKSTNDIAAEMANAGAPDGAVICAEQQTAGRGRLGRSWFSPIGTGIYVSTIFRPAFAPEYAPGMSIMTALALADAIVAISPADARLKQVSIKWPNDILIGERKLAGILTELATEDKTISHVVIGVGINVNQADDDFPEEIEDIATSLRRELGRTVHRVTLLQTFLHNLERQYQKYLVHRLEKDHERIRGYSSLIGKDIVLQAGRVRMEGKVRDIDSEGRLVLETAKGVEPVIAGEVTVMK
jgi:BirA family biotin operon repressor/biotin-[acetyl-CoA-carboxylase] ligase